MSNLNRYQESIIKVTKTKSCIAPFIKNNKILDSILTEVEHYAPIILLTITNNQTKKKGIKAYHGYYMASGIEMLMVMVEILDNRRYYENKYGKNGIDNILAKLPLYIFKCLQQNIETLEDSNPDKKENILKIFSKTVDYLHKKIENIIDNTQLIGSVKVKKTDIIKYEFFNKNIINEKYKKLKRIDKDKLTNYIEQKYGSVYQCAFYIGWCLGFGDEKLLNNFERLGTHFGLIVKLVRDFVNLEKDIDNSIETSSNMIINYGIHTCFSLFSESKLKLTEGAMILGVFTSSIKEILNTLESKFEYCLTKTDLELKSMYSSFSPSTKQKEYTDSIEYSDDS